MCKPSEPGAGTGPRMPGNKGSPLEVLGSGLGASGFDMSSEQLPVDGCGLSCVQTEIVRKSGRCRCSFPNTSGICSMIIVYYAGTPDEARPHGLENRELSDQTSPCEQLQLCACTRPVRCPELCPKCKIACYPGTECHKGPGRTSRGRIDPSPVASRTKRVFAHFSENEGHEGSCLLWLSSCYTPVRA